MASRSYRKYKRKMLQKKVLIILAVLVVVVAAGSYTVLRVFKISEITFEGTDKYTYEQLENMIVPSFGGAGNTLLLTYELRKNPKKQIPFIQTYDVDIKYPDKVHVTLYEKSVVAYVSYKGAYMYIDKDGIVVESSMTEFVDVPRVDGLDFKSIVLYSPLPVEDDRVFNIILDLSQYIDKYQLNIDSIYFDKDMKIYLYMDKVKVSLGTGELLGDRMHALKMMEEGLEGLEGTLNLEKYDKDTETSLFKSNK